MNRRGFLQSMGGMIAAGALGWRSEPTGAAEPAGRRKCLALDSRVIAETINAKLTVTPVAKSSRNTLFAEDKPWEVRFDNLYANVLLDEDDGLYKCWYSPFIRDPAVIDTPFEKRDAVPYRPHDRVMGVCYAESEDGLSWRKPLMDIRKYDGELSNIVEIGPHGAGIFKDTHETEPARRFKMFFNENPMSVAFSADGLHWAPPVKCPQIEAAGDTHNNALWSPERGKYVGLTRLWDKVRQVGRTESPDFLTWTKAQVVLEGLEPHLQTYAMPVFRYCGCYLGLVVIFNTETDRAHTELAWSPDTLAWHRVEPGKALIPNAETEGAYDWGCVYPAAYPVFLKDEVRLYYGGSNGPHTNWRDGFFCLATLRPDGFAGFEPESSDTPGLVRTQPLSMTPPLKVSADIPDGGRIVVAALNGEGKEIAHSRPIATSCTDAEVTWESGFGAPEPLALQFELVKGKLYAFSYAERPGA